MKTFLEAGHATNAVEKISFCMQQELNFLDTLVVNTLVVNKGSFLNQAQAVLTFRVFRSGLRKYALRCSADCCSREGIHRTSHNEPERLTGALMPAWISKDIRIYL
jgi:hypothetical protein